MISLIFETSPHDGSIVPDQDVLALFFSMTQVPRIASHFIVRLPMSFGPNAMAATARVPIVCFLVATNALFIAGEYRVAKRGDYNGSERREARLELVRKKIHRLTID